MAEKRDYYDVLGVNKNATDAEIKAAYRKLARKEYIAFAKSRKHTAKKMFICVNAIVVTQSKYALAY